jgi:hypothetical protein
VVPFKRKGGTKETEAEKEREMIYTKGYLIWKRQSSLIKPKYYSIFGS